MSGGSDWIKINTKVPDLKNYDVNNKRFVCYTSID